MANDGKLTKRSFLKTLGGAPTMMLMSASGAAPPAQATPEGSPNTPKFTPIDCSPHFTASPAEFGPRDAARGLTPESRKDGLIRIPSDERSFRGIPFRLGPSDVREKSWIALSQNRSNWSAPSVEIPIGKTARYVCLAAFCDWDETKTDPPGLEPVAKDGHHLADVISVHDDGTETAHPLRRRFEVSSLTVPWGHLCFAARPHRKETPNRFSDPIPRGVEWGEFQTGVFSANYVVNPAEKWRGTLWLCALENPAPEKAIRTLRLEARSEDPVMICGLSLYHGNGHPLRWERLSLYRFTLPEGSEKQEWEVDADLGLVARSYRLGEFKGEEWLASPVPGLARRGEPAGGSRRLYAEVAASRGATLVLRNASTDALYRFDLSGTQPGAEITGQTDGPRIEFLEPAKVWLHGKVTEASTGHPTPVRLAFRSSQGRYIPPYGHRTEVNAAWFQDYGADVTWDNTSWAYVDGTFQVELPVGEVYVELMKGFEYKPVRRKLRIQPGQRQLDFEISRFADLRSKNWVTADTHVHFLSPSTAVLEGQAEGLNLVNLLAAQWGDLFTNVGDLSYGPLTSSDGETVVQVGTENRQHLLGHLGLLGGQGEPVFPMSAGGPSESYIGDPLWNTMADWADACRKRDGLAVAVHFPNPTAELAADIALGKIDAVELRPARMDQRFNNLPFQEWYRYLNCGYRLPAVAGTDKMSAWTAVGHYRTYARLGDEEFSFANWAEAVRSGNTFVTSGPLLQFKADGREPGGEIVFRAGGGTVEVRAETESIFPVHRLEIVFNGKVVASREKPSGARRMTLSEEIQVPGPGWLAARCYSPLSSGGVRVAAHTSPVYVKVAGQDLFSRPVATYMLTLIEGAETWAKTLATRPDQERFDRVMQLFANARRHVHERLHRHGVPH